jgi:hypothetical protein
MIWGPRQRRRVPGETEGGQRSTGVSTGYVGVGALGQRQRRIAARKREMVLLLFRGEPLDLLSRQLGVNLPTGTIARGRLGGHVGGSQGQER